MYKILGKKVSSYPGIAKPESQKKDVFSGIIIVALKKEGEKIKHYKKIIRVLVVTRGAVKQRL